LEPLFILSKLTGSALVGATVQEIANAYSDWGWKVDQAAMDALATIQSAGVLAGNVNAVKEVVQAIYKPWLEGAASSLQKAIAAGPTSQTYPTFPFKKPEKSTCILFSDALRLDTGQTLALSLISDGYQVDPAIHLAALPAITSTAKFSFSPNPIKITGKGSKSLTPFLTERGSPITAEGFRKILEEEGFQILVGEDLGDPNGLAWTEIGEIDAYGHEHGCKLAIHLKGELLALRNRIELLLDYGWKKVIVLTDHGWLLLPGGLPKSYIPEHLTELRKGRCARLKEGAQTDQQTVPWYWDKDVQIVTAPGICSYEAGKEYEHGGISPQECITPMLTITKADAEANLPVSIESPKWRGLRFTAKIVGAQPDMLVDIRLKAGDAATSLVKEPANPTEQGEVSLLIENEDNLNASAIIVVIAANGLICTQMHTTIGE
jgi:hypothetical protein